MTHAYRVTRHRGRPGRARPHFAALITAFAVAACARDAPDAGGTPGSGADAASPPAQDAGDGGAARASAAPPVRTGRDAYTFAREGEWERTSIDFVYHNPSPDTLYQPTCRGNGVGDPGLSMAVQKRLDERWETVWVPVLLACLSEPILVAPGGTYRDTFEVVLHPQDTTLQPLLNTEVAVDGTYRLIWQQLLRSYDPQSYPFGEEAAETLRVSNAFRLGR
jgi:hypothetical protein